MAAVASRIGFAERNLIRKVWMIVELELLVVGKLGTPPIKTLFIAFPSSIALVPAGPYIPLDGAALLLGLALVEVAMDLL